MQLLILYNQKPFPEPMQKFLKGRLVLVFMIPQTKFWFVSSSQSCLDFPSMLEHPMICLIDIEFRSLIHLHTPETLVQSHIKSVSNLTDISVLFFCFRFILVYTAMICLCFCFVPVNNAMTFSLFPFCSCE